MVDFTGGTWRSLIDGSEVSGIPDTVVLRPEDGDLTHFEGSTDLFEIVSSPTVTQDLTLRSIGDGEGGIFSTEGLAENYPERGIMFETFISEETTTPVPSTLFGDDIDNCYIAEISGAVDEITLGDIEDGTIDRIESASVTIDPDTAYGQRIYWDDPEITYQLWDIDSDGNFVEQLGEVSISDERFDGPGLGFLRESSDDDAYHEFVVLREVLDG